MNLNIHAPLPKRTDWRIGVVGAGFVVNEGHLPAYRKAGFNPAAIAARTRKEADEVARRHEIAKVYDTAEQLLEAPAIQVLDIADPLEINPKNAGGARERLQPFFSKPLRKIGHHRQGRQLLEQSSEECAAVSTAAFGR